eukprot:scaffold30058_cov29-Prasinocladus_malaysianus.AAC.5
MLILRTHPVARAPFGAQRRIWRLARAIVEPRLSSGILEATKREGSLSTRRQRGGHPSVNYCVEVGGGDTVVPVVAHSSVVH